MSIGDGSASPNQARHDFAQRGVTVGFLTDSTLCIGCKACEVACKEWNQVPADDQAFTGHSYDNSVALGASTWRHVKFVEQRAPRGLQVTGTAEDDPLRWLFLSDVCKHCENAGCLEACPTGSLVRTEIGSVYLQDDVCNGCGYCVVACPFGVVERRPQPFPGAGGAFKCTFCYDRQVDGLVPACAKSCPTESILFGPLSELRDRAQRRLDVLAGRGITDAVLYDPRDTSVGGIHAISIVLGDPASFGLPPRPMVPTVHLKASWISAAVTAAVAILGTLAAFLVTG